MEELSKLTEGLLALQARALEGCSVEITAPTTAQVDLLKGVLAMLELSGKSLPCEIRVKISIA